MYVESEWRTRSWLHKRFGQAQIRFEVIAIGGGGHSDYVGGLAITVKPSDLKHAVQLL